MIIEHTFVTTHEPARAFDIAGDMLVSLGFDPHGQAADNHRLWRRGKKTFHKSGNYLLKLPQSIRMDFDRGRVSLACSIDIGNRRERSYVKISNAMLAVASAVELALTQDVSLEEASADAAAKLDIARRRDRRIRITRWTVLLSILAIFVGLIALAIVMSR